MNELTDNRWRETLLMERRLQTRVSKDYWNSFLSDTSVIKSYDTKTVDCIDREEDWNIHVLTR